MRRGICLNAGVAGFCVVLIVASNLLALGTEDTGNEPVIAQNYAEVRSLIPLLNNQSRVYHTWVNGNEFFYYRGDVAAINLALKQFAAYDGKPGEVVIRPGPGGASTFTEGKSVQYDWNVHVMGGISTHLTTLAGAGAMWTSTPIFSIYTSDKLDLHQLNIPKGINVVTIKTLADRCKLAMGSTDKTARGWSCGELAEVDRMSSENAAEIAKMLADPDSWVVTNAVSALPSFGKQAEGALPALRKTLENGDAALKPAVEKAIAVISAATTDEAGWAAHQAEVKAIEKYVAELRQ